MLVISRRKYESVMLGDEIEVTILEVRGDRIRLGIAAPRNLPVHRREIYEKIIRENSSKKLET